MPPHPNAARVKEAIMTPQSLTAAPFSGNQQKQSLWHEIVKNRWAYLFISPFFILFAVFGLFPITYSLYLSFHEWNGMRPIVYVGLDNYSFLLGAGGRVFWQSILNGVILFFMYVPIM